MQFLEFVLLVQTQFNFFIILQNFMQRLAKHVLHFDGQILLDIIVSLLEPVVDILGAVAIASEFSLNHG